MHTFHAFWWLLHILGVALWFGGQVLFSLLWARIRKLPDSWNGDMLQSIFLMFDRVSLWSALLTAVSGTVLSFLVEPRAKLSYFWLTYMQGMGIVALILSVFVLRWLGKTVRNRMVASRSPGSTQTYTSILHLNSLILLTILIMAAFKPH